MHQGSYCPNMPRAHDKSAPISAVVAALDEGRQPDATQLRDAVRTLLSTLARRAPGRSVEVRVPPYGVIQCVGGPRHTRGTPPNVVETDPPTFVRLATGRMTWAQAVDSGNLTASGNRADLSELLPLWPEPD